MAAKRLKLVQIIRNLMALPFDVLAILFRYLQELCEQVGSLIAGA